MSVYVDALTACPVCSPHAFGAHVAVPPRPVFCQAHANHVVRLVFEMPDIIMAYQEYYANGGQHASGIVGAMHQEAAK